MASILFPLKVMRARYENDFGMECIKLCLDCQEQGPDAKIYFGWGELGLIVCADRATLNALFDFDWDGTEFGSRRAIPAVVGRTLSLRLETNVVAGEPSVGVSVQDEETGREIRHYPSFKGG